MLCLKQGRPWILVLFLSIIVPFIMAASCSAEKGFDYFGSLEKRLVKDGFDKARIGKLYKSKKAAFDVKGVSLYFVHREGSLNYSKFASKSRLKRCVRYMKRHKKVFEKTEKAYGVSKEVITAIILVESGLGSNFGRRKVFNTLSTMSALADKEVKDRLWEEIKTKTKLTKEKYNAKADKKSAWAYDELTAFLKYTKMEKLDTMKITGSYAGAVGIPQFMPSNILTLAKDGNNDGKIDMTNHDDAIMSVASYLKHYGWHPKINGKKAYDVVYAYNHSSYYVNTILDIAKKLKGLI